MHNGGMQIEMAQTFNLAILNNNMNTQRNKIANKTMQGLNNSNLDEPITQQHLRGIRTVSRSPTTPFP